MYMHLMAHRSTNQHLRYTKLFFFWIFVLIQIIWDMFHWNRSNFRFWPPVQIWSDLWPIILCNLKTKHRRCLKPYIFGILMTRQTIWHYFQRNRSMFHFWPMWNSQGQWRPSWKCHNMWHIRKMLFLLCLYSLPNLTLLTDTAQ